MTAISPAVPGYTWSSDNPPRRCQGCDTFTRGRVRGVPSHESCWLIRRARLPRGVLV
jgi:hypothetical protein